MKVSKLPKKWTELLQILNCDDLITFTFYLPNRNVLCTEIWRFNNCIFITSGIVRIVSPTDVVFQNSTNNYGNQCSDCNAKSNEDFD